MTEDSSEAPTSKPPQVLIVDDDTAIRDSLREVLLDEGYTVASVSNGAEALRAIARRSPGIILLDLMMPEINGWGVLKKLRGDEATANIPVAVLSAQAGTAPEGSQVVLQKPVRLERLLTVVSTYCAPANADGGAGHAQGTTAEIPPGGKSDT